MISAPVRRALLTGLNWELVLRKNKYLRALMVSALLTIGCGDDGAGEALGVNRAAITGGMPVPPDQHNPPDTSAVKILVTENPGNQVGCTAIKVASNVFWTAGHCLEHTSVGKPLQITNNLDGDFAGQGSYSLQIASFDYHPSRRNWTTMIFEPIRPGRTRHYDVGRFTLNGSTPLIPSYSITDAAWVGPNQRVTYTGYGCDQMNPNASGTKQYAFFDLVDLPTLKTVLTGQNDYPTDYYAHNMAAINLPAGCEGDSGSAVTKQFGSTWKVVGLAISSSVSAAPHTGFVRYSNVRGWLAAPSLNQIQPDARRFLFNQVSGYCLANSVGSAPVHAICDGRDQNLDFESWRLGTSGVAGAYYLINGSSGLCLDLSTTAEGALLTTRTCLPTTQANHTQRWTFDTSPGTGQQDYRRLKNLLTGRCTQPLSPDSTTDFRLASFTCVSSPATSVRNQAWMLTP